MDLLTELARQNVDPGLIEELKNLLASQAEQCSASTRQIQLLELKNQKLAHELAYLKRLRFGV